MRNSWWYKFYHLFLFNLVHVWWSCLCFEYEKCKLFKVILTLYVTWFNYLQVFHVFIIWIIHNIERCQNLSEQVVTEGSWDQITKNPAYMWEKSVFCFDKYRWQGCLSHRRGLVPTLDVLLQEHVAYISTYLFRSAQSSSLLCLQKHHTSLLIKARELRMWWINTIFDSIAKTAFQIYVNMI